MSTWNHRVLAHKSKNPNCEGEVYFQIHEVHYNKKGNPKSYTQNGVSVGGEGYADIQWVLSQMQECLTKPVLDVDNWPNEFKGEFLSRKVKK